MDPLGCGHGQRDGGVRLVAEREVSSEELVRECLARIEERDGELRAWAHLDPELGDRAGARA